MSIDDQLAPADSLLGLLQRGRGLGHLRALESPKGDVAAALSMCMREDPRWDRQLESRCAFWAEIVSAVDMPLVDVQEAVRAVAQAGTGQEEETLPVGVLRDLAARGSAEALALLREEVLVGPGWLAAANALGQCASRDVWAPLGDRLFGRFGDSEVGRLAGESFVYIDPWKTWALEVPRLRSVMSEAVLASLWGPQDEYQPAKISTEKSTLELLLSATRRTSIRVGRVLAHRKRPGDLPVLRHALRSDSPWTRAAALRGLGALDDTTCFEAAVALVREDEPHESRRAAIEYVAGLPSELTRPYVRGWLSAAWPVYHLGREVLEEHSCDDDVPLLLSELEAGMRDGDQYRCCFAVEALTPLDAPQAEALIRTYYETAAYEYGRGLAAEALEGLESDFAQRTAFECLFDCDLNARHVGIRCADRQVSGVDARLAFLAGDVCQGEYVQKAAAARLK